MTLPDVPEPTGLTSPEAIPVPQSHQLESPTSPGTSDPEQNVLGQPPASTEGDTVNEEPLQAAALTTGTLQYDDMVW